MFNHKENLIFHFLTSKIEYICRWEMKCKSTLLYHLKKQEYTYENSTDDNPNRSVFYTVNPAFNIYARDRGVSFYPEIRKIPLGPCSPTRVNFVRHKARHQRSPLGMLVPRLHPCSSDRPDREKGHCRNPINRYSATLKCEKYRRVRVAPNFIFHPVFFLFFLHNAVERTARSTPPQRRRVIDIADFRKAVTRGTRGTDGRRGSR